MFDATSPHPDLAKNVSLHGEVFDRDGLTTAWLLLADHNTPEQAVRALREDGWPHDEAARLVDAAAGWTGRVVRASPGNHNHDQERKCA